MEKNTSLSAEKNSTQKTDQSNKAPLTGLIIAMQSELDAILERMEDIQSEKTGPAIFYTGTLCGKPVAVSLAGVGKVAAAISTALMCELYKPDLLLNIGVAGGLKPEQNVTDMVLSDKIIQADFDTSPIDGPAGLGKVFQADEELIQKGLRTAKKLGIPYTLGTIATLDIFMTDGEDYHKLMKRFPESACSEMEGGAIAQAAAGFDVPVFCIRSLSDIACKKDNPMQFDQFTKIACKRAADFIECWMEEE